MGNDLSRRLKSIHNRISSLTYLVLLGATLCIPAFATPVRYYYIGAIQKTPVQIELNFEGKTITGHYYNKSGELITLKGLRKPDNQVFIREILKNNVSGGSFKGTVTPNLRSWSGYWISNDNKQKAPFKMDAVSRYLFEKRKQEGIQITAAYPQFLGSSPATLGLNKLVKTEFDKQILSLNKEAKMVDVPDYFKDHSWELYYNTDIAYAAEDLISLESSSYQFTGGAHGMTYYTAANYQLQSGKYTLIRLEDLFAPKSGYIAALSQLILDDLRNKGAMWVTTGKVTRLEAPDLDNFTITPRGLTFFFDPYEMGPYAQGGINATIPYSSLLPYLKPVKPLDRFIPAPRRAIRHQNNIRR